MSIKERSPQYSQSLGIHSGTLLNSQVFFGPNLHINQPAVKLDVSWPELADTEVRHHVDVISNLFSPVSTDIAHLQKELIQQNLSSIGWG